VSRSTEVNIHHMGGEGMKTRQREALLREKAGLGGDIRALVIEMTTSGEYCRQDEAMMRRQLESMLDYWERISDRLLFMESPGVGGEK